MEENKLIWLRNIFVLVLVNTNWQRQIFGGRFREQYTNSKWDTRKVPKDITLRLLAYNIQRSYYCETLIETLSCSEQQKIN